MEEETIESLISNCQTSTEEPKFIERIHGVDYCWVQSALSPEEKLTCCYLGSQSERVLVRNAAVDYLAYKHRCHKQKYDQGDGI